MKKGIKILLWVGIPLIILGLVITFMVMREKPIECTSGDDKCIDLVYYICQEGNWDSQGEIPGKCGVSELPDKKTYYRFEDNECSAVSLYLSEKTIHDYLTLDSCQDQIIPTIKEFHQEDADSVEFGGYPSPAWILSSDLLVDGNYNTFANARGYRGAVTATMTLEYNHPNGVVGAIWKVKDGIGTEEIEIPLNCLGTNILKLKVSSYYYADFGRYSSTWACGNGIVLRSSGITSDANTNKIYEESVTWEIET